MIRYGPAGIPLSCKGRTLKDGIEDVHNLALTALEVQMVRPKTDCVPPDDDEVGLSIDKLGPESGFVIGVQKEDGDLIYDPKETIEDGDNLIVLLSGVASCYKDLYSLGHMAVRHDIKLSLHTPYYMDLGCDPMSENEEEAIRANQYLEILMHSALVTNALSGDIVVTNAGLYDDKKRSREQTEANIHSNLEILLDWWEEAGIKSRLGIEITGQQNVFGTIDQVLDLCDDFDRKITPVLNFPHYQAKTRGALNTASDFVEVLNTFAAYSPDGIYASFSNVEFTPDGNEKWLTPLKKGELRFERLAEALAELKPDMTLISSSPLLEHDAVYMRTLTERVFSKKAAKYLKDKKKQELEAATAE